MWCRNYNIDANEIVLPLSNATQNFFVGWVYIEHRVLRNNTKTCIGAFHALQNR